MVCWALCRLLVVKALVASMRRSGLERDGNPGSDWDVTSQERSEMAGEEESVPSRIVSRGFWTRKAFGFMFNCCYLLLLVATCSMQIWPLGGASFHSALGGCWFGCGFTWKGCGWCQFLSPPIRAVTETPVDCKLSQYRFLKIGGNPNHPSF